MEWKFTNDRPIWIQLSEQLIRRMITGVYPPGSRLPPVRELAAEAGVNPNTMQRALAQLEQEGLTHADRTAGRLVTQDEALLNAARRNAADEVMAQYFTAMAALGYTRREAIAALKEDER
jgi:DNA-binding transcriptional regulator YhcF (GntR family)